MGTYKWERENETVRFKGFDKQQIADIQPALRSTDLLLSPNRKLNAEFHLTKPKKVDKAVALTTYNRLFHNSRARVDVSPDVFDPDLGWNPPGVVSHEIGHLLGPTRNVSHTQRRQFQRSFGYRQKLPYQTLSPQKWIPTKRNPLRGERTRQSVDSSEDFAETFRAITGEPLVNRTSHYFDTVITPKRLAYMERYYVK